MMRSMKLSPEQRLAAIIFHWRIDSKLSLRDAADRLGIWHSTIARFEDCKRWPTAAHAAKLISHGVITLEEWTAIVAERENARLMEALLVAQ